ncbi:hypothetical protein ACQUY5_26840 [Bacillus cereus]|uniref:hypothetical protein n=1 Tax=Bacillus cereus TaxID=1396 RepID=UPI003D1729DE
MTVEMATLDTVVTIGVFVIQTIIFLGISILLLLKKDLIDYKRVWIPTLLTLPLYITIVLIGDTLEWSNKTSILLFFGLAMGSFFPMYFFTYLAERNYRNKYRHTPKYIKFMLLGFRTFFFLVITFVYSMLVYHFVTGV